MMRMNREFAHAAVRERYKPDADRDEAYELWFLACLLFKDRNAARGYFDKDEAGLMIDLYDEWRTLAQPLEVQKFGEDPIWTRIEHLKLFASAYSSHELDELKKGARADFLFCVNQLGQRFEQKKEKI
jgi:hypothetical protein